MSNSTETQVPVPKEKTFTSFSQAQGTNYAQNRPGYHPSLYKTIIDYHTSTGGQLDSLLDVGCGPGIAVRELAPLFAHAVGIDPSEGMIKNAILLGGTSSTSEPIRYEIAAAEDLGSHLSPPIEDTSVDLVTAAAAAHWFDMKRFWPSAARVLKPGGTVALWTIGPVRIHESTPNSVAIQKALDDIDEIELKPYIEPGNLLSQNLYKDLPLPWTLLPAAAVFDRSLFFKKEWGSQNSDEFFVGGALTTDMDRMESVMSTMSPVQRWREAHPETAGTERDVVQRMRSEIERLMQEAGVKQGSEVVQGKLSGVLLLVKKKGQKEARE